MMHNEPIEVQLARLDERNKMILMRLDQNQVEAKEARGQLKDAFESLRGIDARLERLEGSFATTKPTIDEFRSIKQKVLGAGTMGRWVWVALTGILGFLYTIREHIVTFLTK